MVDMRTICTLEIQPKIASALKIAGGQGLPHMDPSDSDAFGSAVAWMSASADADGLSLLAVGAARDISGADESESMPWRVGSVYIFQVSRHSTHSYTRPPAAPLQLASSADTQVLRRVYASACGIGATNGDAFGFALASVGDVNGNGVNDLAIGIPYRSSSIYQHADAGAVCIVSFDAGLEVVSSLVLDLEMLGAAETPAVRRLQQHSSQFGCALAAIGDLNGDGVPDLAASACGVDDGAGAVVVLLLSPAAEVLAVHVLSASAPVGGGSLALPHLFVQSGSDGRLGFGTCLTGVGDLDADGRPELVVSVSALDGFVVAHLAANGTLRHVQPLMYTNGSVVRLSARAISALADVNSDSIPDLLVGGFGTARILTLQHQGQVADEQPLQTGPDAVFAGLDVGEGTYFGNALALSRDMNGDYTIDLAVGAYGQTNSFQGSVYVINLRPGVGTLMKTSSAAIDAPD